ncbi:hypothetical protein GCM10023088_35620 [Actinomadura verrucosospora]
MGFLRIATGLVRTRPVRTILHESEGDEDAGRNFVRRGSAAGVPAAGTRGREPEMVRKPGAEPEAASGTGYLTCGFVDLDVAGA